MIQLPPLNRIVESVDEVSSLSQIDSASARQASSLNQVTQGVDQISTVVQTNSATAEEVPQQARSLRQASMLEALSRFKFTSTAQSNTVLPKYKTNRLWKQITLTLI